MASGSVQLQAICRKLSVWCVDPMALHANLRLSSPKAFAIHHVHIQMASIVSLVLFLCKVAALKSWYVSVGSSFIIHLVVQLSRFVEEEMETQRGEISWSKLPSYVVSSWDKDIYLLDLSPMLIPAHQDLVHFGKTWRMGFGVSTSQMQILSLLFNCCCTGDS